MIIKWLARVLAPRESLSSPSLSQSALCLTHREASGARVRNRSTKCSNLWVVKAPAKANTCNLMTQVNNKRIWTLIISVPITWIKSVWISTCRPPSLVWVEALARSLKRASIWIKVDRIRWPLLLTYRWYSSWTIWSRRGKVKAVRQKVRKNEVIHHPIQQASHPTDLNKINAWTSFTSDETKQIDYRVDWNIKMGAKTIKVYQCIFKNTNFLHTLTK